jgi:tight adherence protein B
VTAGVVVVAALWVMAGGRGARRWSGRTVRARLGLAGPASVISHGPSPLERWLGPRLVAADLAWPPPAVLRGAGAAILGVAVVGAATRPLLGLLAPPAAAGGAVLALHLARHRREARMEAEVPELLEAVSRALRSGAALPSALREAATTESVAAEDLALVLADVDHGLGLGDALDGWAGRRPTATVRLVVGALSVAAVSGGRPARGVDGVAATLRERAEVAREGRSLATQARVSAVVVSVAPLAFGALGALGDPRAAGFLLGSPTGLVCLFGGLALDLAGAAWMHRIARGPS